MHFVMRGRMSDKLAFLERLDVREACRQADMKKIDRKGG
jgi:hypothetical protein